jgi:hypothetical protein
MQFEVARGAFERVALIGTPPAVRDGRIQKSGVRGDSREGAGASAGSDPRRDGSGSGRPKGETTTHANPRNRPRRIARREEPERRTSIFQARFPVRRKARLFETVRNTPSQPLDRLSSFRDGPPREECANRELHSPRRGGGVRSRAFRSLSGGREPSESLFGQDRLRRPRPRWVTKSSPAKFGQR